MLNVRSPHTAANAGGLTHLIGPRFSAGGKGLGDHRGFSLCDLLPIFQAAEKLMFRSFRGSRGLQRVEKGLSNQCAFMIFIVIS